MRQRFNHHRVKIKVIVLYCIVLYPKAFQGIGQLKDFKLHLHDDPNVPPVAQKLRSPVCTSWKSLCQNKWVAEGKYHWASRTSPVVVAPKPSGEIRLCMDMRWANKAIFRERLPIPTVDEVLEELNGSTMFSKLDLCWGFHQIELHEELRDTISSITHCSVLGWMRHLRNTSMLSGKQ